MNVDNLKNWGKQSAITTGAIIGVNAVGLPSQIRSVLPNNKIGSHLSAGTSYATANDIVNMVFDKKKSKLMNGNWLNFADDVGFFSAASAVGNETPAIESLYNLVNKVSPFNRDVNLDITEGAFVAGVTMVADSLDYGTNNTKAAAPFDWLRRPVTTSMMFMK